MLLLDVGRDFDKACEAACDKTPELRPLKEQLVPMAKNHERRPVCLNRLSDQILLYEKAFKHLPRERIQRDRARIIETVASMFMKAIKVARDHQNMSSAEKTRIENADSLLRDVAQLIKEAPRDRQGLE